MRVQVITPVASWPHWWFWTVYCSHFKVVKYDPVLNFPKQKKLSILDYTWTDASPGISTFLPKGNILASHSPKCTGCWAVSPNFL
jgi:hypothetical protein